MRKTVYVFIIFDGHVKEHTDAYNLKQSKKKNHKFISHAKYTYITPALALALASHVHLQRVPFFHNAYQLFFSNIKQNFGKNRGILFWNCAW